MFSHIEFINQTLYSTHISMSQILDQYSSDELLSDKIISSISTQPESIYSNVLNKAFGENHLKIVFFEWLQNEKLWLHRFRKTVQQNFFFKLSVKKEIVFFVLSISLIDHIYQIFFQKFRVSRFIKFIFQHPKCLLGPKLMDFDKHQSLVTRLQSEKEQILKFLHF